MSKNCEFFYKTSKSNRIFNLYICLDRQTDKKDMVLKESYKTYKRILERWQVLKSQSTAKLGNIIANHTLAIASLL